MDAWGNKVRHSYSRRPRQRAPRTVDTERNRPACHRETLTLPGDYGALSLQMMGALEVVARMCALGLGLKEDAITSLMHEGPHLLAPTGEETWIPRNTGGV